MSDLTRELAVVCAQIFYGDTFVGNHQVLWYQGTVACDCGGLQHPGLPSKVCEHMRLAQAQACRWNVGADPSVKMTDDGACPLCGGAVVPVWVTV